MESRWNTQRGIGVERKRRGGEEEEEEDPQRTM